MRVFTMPLVGFYLSGHRALGSGQRTRVWCFASRVKANMVLLGPFLRTKRVT